MPEEFTENQKKAIFDKGNTLLVSAAAGSGKTSVLIERIVARITDDTSPCDIGDMLVVTFTNAAAAEIRQRLTERLSKEISSNPSGKRLIRQLALVGSASIETIDAFFLETVKRNCDKSGISPNISVCDTATNDAVFAKACGDILEKKYKSEPKDGSFYRFAENFSDVRSDENVEVFLKEFYDLLYSLPDCKRYADFCIKQYEGVASGSIDYMESAFGKHIRNDIVSACDYAISVYEKFTEENGKVPELIKLSEHFEEIIGIHKSLRLLVSKEHPRFAEIYDFFANTKYARCPIKSDKAFAKVQDIFERQTGVRKSVKEKCFTKIKQNYFMHSENTLKSIAKIGSDIIRTATALLEEIDGEMMAIKKERNILSFSDIPRLCTQLLFTEDENGKTVPSEVLKELSDRYKEIYIDEYQDTSAIQDNIFSGIASGNVPRFMVGDVKQCIYAFRSSDPELFTEYYNEFSDYEENRAGKSMRILLSENFRSDKNIVDTVNMIFTGIMSKLIGGTDYGENEKLVFGKKSTSSLPCELVVITDDKMKADERRKLQAEMTAKKIKKLLADKQNGYDPSDIAVLVGKNSEISIFSSALAKENIPVSSGGIRFEQSSEVMLIMSVLSAVDNHSKDIDLAGAMCSPVFSFTFDELTRIMTRGSYTSLWDAVLDSANFDEKVRAFVSRMSDYRNYSNIYGTAKLIEKICLDSDLDMIAASAGEGRYRKANIEKLIELAKNCGSSGYRGLSEYIAYMKRYFKSSFDDRNVSSAPGVKICTVHKSKGLQYKVCFVVDLESMLINKSEKSQISFAKNVPVAFRIRHPSGICAVESPIANSVGKTAQNTSISEKMRVLYVASTRAMERLCLMGAMETEAFENTVKSIYGMDFPCAPFAIHNSSSQLEWILRALSKKLSEEELLACANTHITDESLGYLNVSVITPEMIGKEDDVTLSAEDAVCVPEGDGKYVYPHIGRTKIPSKLSVSELSREYGGYGSGAASEISGISSGKSAETEIPSVKPDFIDDKASSAAEKGTAMHSFMQFCDFDGAEKDLISEADRCTELGFITKRQRSLLDFSELSAFFKSGLFAMLRSSDPKDVHRELRYNLRDSAGKYCKDKTDTDGETVLVQGVIDCFFKTGDGKLVLVDFKTDRVSGKDAESVLIKRHGFQLRLYSDAIGAIMGQEVSKIYIYSFALSKAIEVPISEDPYEKEIL